MSHSNAVPVKHHQPDVTRNKLIMDQMTNEDLQAIRERHQHADTSIPLVALGGHYARDVGLLLAANAFAEKACDMATETMRQLGRDGLSIRDALRLARDEGKRVRCKEWAQGIWLAFGHKKFCKYYGGGAWAPPYVPRTAECEAEWEVITDA